MSHDTHQRYEWNAIPWRKLEVKVFKLQRRIYQATTRGETKKAHRLQKLLASSWSAKSLAVRRVTQENKGKKTAGVDGASNLTPPQRLKLISTMDLHAPVNPVRRIWIPKPGKPEKRPLGIPIMHDRGTQALAKMALEPEWEAKFEPNSFGFRPGRSCQDAIRQIYNVINLQPRYVLDADIASCFDKIDQAALLEKMATSPFFARPIRQWLKAGVVDQETFMPTQEGTPQGGVTTPPIKLQTFFSGLASPGYESTRKTTFTRSGVTSTRLTKARIISRLLSQSESSNPAAILAAKSSKRPTIRRISVCRAVTSMSCWCCSSSWMMRCRRRVIRGSNSCFSNNPSA